MAGGRIPDLLSELLLVLDNLPDEPVVGKLEQERDRGRDRYPIRPMWNALIAGVVFQHPTVESLLENSDATRSYGRCAASS